MIDTIAKGTWVEIHRIVLPPDQRAPRVPEDTREVPLEMRVKGFLAADAAPGAETEIVTLAGRRLRGIVTEVCPAYTHGFGDPIPELLSIGSEARAILNEVERDR